MQWGASRLSRTTATVLLRPYDDGKRARTRTLHKGKLENNQRVWLLLLFPHNTRFGRKRSLAGRVEFSGAGWRMQQKRRRSLGGRAFIRKVISGLHGWSLARGAELGLKCYAPRKTECFLQREIVHCATRVLSEIVRREIHDLQVAEFVQPFHSWLKAAIPEYRDPEGRAV